MSSLREINIKYYACFYTDDIINIKDLELDKILVYKKPYKNSFISCIAYKIPHNELSLHITFDRVNGYVEKPDRDKHLLFRPSEKYETMFNRVKNIFGQKSNFLDVCYYNYMKIGINSDDDLPLEKT